MQGTDHVINILEKGHKTPAANLVGRYVMVDACVLWTAFKGMCKVDSSTGATLVVHPVRLRWDETLHEGAGGYFHKPQDDVETLKMQVRSVGVVMDTIAEGIALANHGQKVGTRYRAFLETITTEVNDMDGLEIPDVPPPAPGP